MTALSIALAALIALLLLTAEHFVSERLFGDLPLLWRYIVGVASILAVFAGWCAVQPPLISPWLALGALVAVTVGAGLGTMAGHGADFIETLMRAYDVSRKENKRPRP